MKNALSALIVLLTATILFGQSDDSLRTALRPYLSPKAWESPNLPAVTRDTLIQSLDAARRYYLAQQKKEGNFTYALDIATGDVSNDDNQVRQAGALWGLARLHQAYPADSTRSALMQGLDFVTTHTRKLETGETVFVYPGDSEIKTGTIALLVMALLDFQEDPKIPEDLRQHYRRLTFSFIAYLRTMEMSDGSWAKDLDLSIGFRNPDASAYYDGEALLAYTKAARILKRKDLLERINTALPKLIRKYTVNAWALGGNDELTKGFYQWGSMSCDQYVTAGWTPHAALAADAALALAYWQICTNQIENRKGNTAYALEGLAATLHIAELTSNTEAFNAIAPVARRTIARLLLCQFRGPLSHHNPYFRKLQSPAPAATGGITDTPSSSIVRIDIVQHQVHAMLLLLDVLYK